MPLATLGDRLSSQPISLYLSVQGALEVLNVFAIGTEIDAISHRFLVNPVVNAIVAFDEEGFGFGHCELI